MGDDFADRVDRCRNLNVAELGLRVPNDSAHEISWRGWAHMLRGAAP